MRALLATVAVLAAVSAAGSAGDHGAMAAGSTDCGSPPRHPGRVLDYEVRPVSARADADVLARTRKLLCRRLAVLGVREARVVSLENGRELEVTLPAGADVARGRAEFASVGRLGLYNWEASLIGRERTVGGHPCRRAPRGALRSAEAEWERAGRRGRGTAELIRTGALPSAAAAARLAGGTGSFVVSEYPTSSEGTPIKGAPGWYALRSVPALVGSEITHPEARETEGGIAVTFEFTGPGRRAFQRVTRTIAHAGRREAGKRFSRSGAVACSHHFAVIVDRTVATRPIINFRENPNGIDGRVGAQISGGFSSRSDAEELAAVMQTGTLPLRLVRLKSSAG